MTRAFLVMISIGGCLFLVGCGRLSKRAAADVVSRDWRDASGKLLPTKIAEIDFPIGDLTGLGIRNNDCSDVADEPSRLERLREYERGGLVSISKAAPCVWRVVVRPEILNDLTPEDRAAPAPGAYKFVIVMLGELRSVDVDRVDQNGEHAAVDVTESFAFTKTMSGMAKAGVFPKLDLENTAIPQKYSCSYDLPTSQIICRSRSVLARVDKHWIVDTSNER